MAAIVGLVAANWRPIAILTMICAIAIGATVLVRQRDSARNALATANGQLALARADAASCQAVVAKQNAATQSLHVAAERAAQAQSTRETKVAAHAAADLTRAEQQAAQLASASLAPGCDAAIRWGNAQAQELGKW